jgi:phosphoribosylamine-glycine ligase
MPENQRTIPEIQELCRRFAARIGDPEASRILYELAEELEEYARHPVRPNTLN